MMSIKLSVIIPVYKVEKYVGQCLGSILNDGTFRLPLEVIVVNDGTTDRSMEVVKDFERYPNLTVINQENLGLSIARNVGLERATGEYVWFVDSDDWLVNGAIEKVVNIISEDDAPDMIASGLIWSYDDESKNFCDMHCIQDVTITGREYFSQQKPIGAIQRFVIRRSVLSDNRITFYPGIYHEDGLFGKQVVYLSKQIKVLSSSVYHYRQREEGSIMHSLSMKNAYDIITMHQQEVRFCEEYVKTEDRIWFRLRTLKDLNTSLVFTWKLRYTAEFKKFLKDTKKYRQKECNHCMFKGSFKNTLKCVLMKYFPMTYCRLSMRHW